MDTIQAAGWLTRGSDRTVWGLGETEASALADGAHQAMRAGVALAADELYAYPATAELMAAVESTGGRCAWRIMAVAGAWLAVLA